MAYGLVRFDMTMIPRSKALGGRFCTCMYYWKYYRKYWDPFQASLCAGDTPEYHGAWADVGASREDEDDGELCCVAFSLCSWRAM